MSKYANIEQIKEVIRTEWVRYIPMELDINLSFVLGKISEVPTIEDTEDCISREWVKGICEDMLDEEMLEHMLGYIENAPSVIPTQSNAIQHVESVGSVGRAEGEWVAKDGVIYCSCCNNDSGLSEEDVDLYEIPLPNYCKDCGAKMGNCYEHISR